MSIRTAIVDDEPLARTRIRDLLQDHEEIEIVGEYGASGQLPQLLDRTKPDLLFLDVHMPERDGFQLLEAMDEPVPAVVFATAHDQYALRAFDFDAVDYLLKPFDETRFQQALQRAKDKLHNLNNGSDGSATVVKTKTGRGLAHHLVVKSGGCVLFLKTDEIDYVEAAGNYLNLHVGKERHLIRETMQGLEARLDPERFLRIHRSRIVNIERIRELQPWFGGEYIVLLRDGQKLRMSRNYRNRVQQLLEA